VKSCRRAITALRGDVAAPEEAVRCCGAEIARVMNPEPLEIRRDGSCTVVFLFSEAALEEPFTVAEGDRYGFEAEVKRDD
jgi:hypothetical protein